MPIVSLGHVDITQGINDEQKTLATNMLKPAATIVQIIPADGWKSLRREDDGRIFKESIVCWALVYETNDVNGDTDDYIVPMVADLQGIIEPLKSYNDKDEIVYNESDGYIKEYEIPKYLQDKF